VADEPPSAPKKETEGQDKRLERTRLTLTRGEMVFVLFIAVFIAIGLLSAAFFVNVNPEAWKPALLLTLLLTLSVILLIATLGAYAIVLHGVGLSPEAPDSQALGLPEGSVRAVLALALVLVFAILAVFLFYQLQNPPTTVSSGLTAEQVNLFGAGQVVEIKPEPSSSPQTFTVAVAPGGEASTQVAQQLITVLATLVTAVAAFYFGASTVKEAHQAGKDAASGTSTSGSGSSGEKTKSDHAPEGASSSGKEG
jgi:hypothetical protein